MKKLAIALILMLIMPAALAMPESVQMYIGETYDFGEPVASEGDAVSVSGSVATGERQGAALVRNAAGETCFVAIRDQNAMCYLHGIARLVTHYVGESFSITGTIYSKYPIYSVTVRISDADGDELLASEQVLGAYKYSMASLDAKVKFSLLTIGEKRMTIDVETAMGWQNVWDVNFTVAQRDWQTLNKAQISSSEAVEAFFGDESYLFRYAVREDGTIEVDDNWINQNIATVGYFYGLNYDVNIKAASRFEAAFRRIYDAAVEITYENGETRFGGLMELVTYCLGDGTYNARMTAGGNYFSSHSFGTAIDVNSSLQVNGMSEENRARIAEAMGKIKFTGVEGATYKFTYDANPPKTGIAPDEIKNLLLYEIAFAPEGFNWGYYFSQPCDPMHFTLTEIPANARVALVP